MNLRVPQVRQFLANLGWLTLRLLLVLPLNLYLPLVAIEVLGSSMNGDRMPFAELL
jgi:hypothetical protein